MVVIEPFGDGAGVEGTRSAEGEEGVIGRIRTFADGDGLDRVGHLLDREIEESGEKSGIGFVDTKSGLLLQFQGRVAGGGEIPKR